MKRAGNGDRAVVRLSDQAGSVIGVETGKTRPCVVISPNELNGAISTVIVAPMTTVRRGWPSRVAVFFQQKHGEIALDQIRALDKSRLLKKGWKA